MKIQEGKFTMDKRGNYEQMDRAGRRNDQFRVSVNYGQPILEKEVRTGKLDKEIGIK